MKKVKFILPVVAIVFAVVGVFATENSTSALVPVDATLGYLIPEPDDNCIKDGTCSNSGSADCTTTSGVILKVRINGSSCEDDAVGTFVSLQ